MNNALRILIARAQTICLEKLEMAKMSRGADAPALAATEKRMEQLFDRLSDPGVWAVPLQADAEPINQNILALEALGKDRAAEIPEHINRLLDQIDQSILQSDLESTGGPGDAPPTNDMNLQVMNALARTRQQIGIRLVKFAQEGQDLQQDPEFQTMQGQQETLVGTYWEKLKTNAITGRETDVNNIRQRGEFIATSAVVGTFKVHYKLLSEFIRSKLTPVTALLFIVFSATGQNLIDDGRKLLNALETVQDTSLSPGARDAAARQALLILYLYDDPAQLEKPGQVPTGRLLDHIQGNTLFRELLPARYLDTFRRKELPAPTSAEWDSLQTPGRRQISNLMHSGAPLSPVQYLSVQQSLQNSQIPPLQNSAAMRSAAENLQKPGPVTGLRTEVLLEGLFNFILERAQQEVTINFLDHLLNNKLPQIGWLFPNVRERYSNPDISYSQSFLESLREAFFLDLSRLNLTLPELLLKDEYFGELQRDPVFYNLLTVYTIFGLTKSDVPLWEAVPLTHRNLYENFEAAGQKLNIRLADSASTTTEYLQVQDAAKAYVEQLQRVSAEILDIENQCENRIVNLQQNREGPLPPRPTFPVNPLYDYRVLTGRSDPNAVFHLGLLPQLLQGAIDDATLSRYNTLSSYDKFFAVPYSGREMRIAGLELARKLTDGTWYNDLTQADILKRWQADLAAYIGEIDRWQMSFDTLNLAGQFQETDNQRGMVANVIDSTCGHWKASGDPADLQALVLLGAIAADFEDIIPEDLSYQDSVRMLGLRREKLLQIEKRLGAVEQRLAEKDKAAASDSPFQRYLKRDKAVRPIDKITGEIEKLRELSIPLRQALQQLDNTRAQNEHKAWLVSRPLLQVTELLSHVFYALQRPDGKGLLTLGEMDEMLREPKLKTACLGLLQQRISRIKNVGVLSPEALAQFTRLTLQDFLELQAPKADSPSGEKPDSLRLYKTISTASRAFNRILEFPLFADPAIPGDFKPLTKRYPVLQYLPDISERCVNFLYYLETRQYRPAVSALVRLVTSLSKQIQLAETLKGQKIESGKKEQQSTAKTITSGKKQEKQGSAEAGANRKYLLHFFEQYGDFIAGLVDARDKNEVENLLKSLADPPGSSRTKRTHRFTASLNAYLGASAGWENWRRKQGNITTVNDFGTLAPAIPVGFTLSKLFWPESSRPQSFSLHVTVLDLGGMMTYRLAEEDKYGAYKLTFKNVLKPGLQLHWNIQKSPFYLGMGWQTGPQFRQENGEEVALRASRVFFTFGIDTPIRTLYAR